MNADATTRLAVELEGHPPGTPLHEALVVAKKVEACQLQRDLSACSECAHYEPCALVKAHLRNLKYGVLAPHLRQHEETLRARR